MKNSLRCLSWLLPVAVCMVGSFPASIRAGDKIEINTPVPVPPWVTERMEQKYSVKNDFSTPVMPPIRDGFPPPICEDAPTDQVVLRALAQPARSIPYIYEESRDDVRIVKERIVDRIDPPRFFPLVGLAQLHHCHWKCSTYFTETVSTAYPFPAKVVKKRVQVIYIDKDYLHSCDASNNDPKSAVAPLRDFAYVPDDALGFATVRVADLVDKFGFKGRLKQLSALLPLESEYGVGLHAIDRATFIMVGPTPETIAVVVSSLELVRREMILKKIADERKNVQLHGKECHIGKHVAVCFVSDRLTLIATSAAALESCLKQAKEPQTSEEMDAAVTRAAKYDAFAWVKGDLLPQCELPVPVEIEHASLGLNFGDKIALDVRVKCADADGVRWAKKALHTVVDMARMQLLACAAMFGMAELMPNMADKSALGEMGFLPVKLMSTAEKGLQKARITTEGTTVCLAVEIPVDLKRLRAEVGRLVRLATKKADGNSPGVAMPFGIVTTEMTGMTLPSGQYLQRPPQYIPTETSSYSPPTAPMPTITMGLPASVPPGAYLPAPSAGPATPLPLPLAPSYPIKASSTPAPPATGTGYPPPLPYGPVPVPVGKLPPPTAEPTVLPASVTPATVRGVPGSIKFAVANVHKTTAQVFELGSDGKAMLLCKIPAGEAADVSVHSGHRCLAVFVEKPDAEPLIESFTPTKTEAVWLLRPPARVGP